MTRLHNLKMHYGKLAREGTHLSLADFIDERYNAYQDKMRKAARPVLSQLEWLQVIL